MYTFTGVPDPKVRTLTGLPDPKVHDCIRVPDPRCTPLREYLTPKCAPLRDYPTRKKCMFLYDYPTPNAHLHGSTRPQMHTFRIQDPESRILYPGSRILDTLPCILPPSLAFYPPPFIQWWSTQLPVQLSKDRKTKDIKNIREAKRKDKRRRQGFRSRV